MPIAIAVLRRAAHELSENNKQITYLGLARKIQRPSWQVHNFVKRIDGLADELGICRPGDYAKRYQAALDALEARGLLVTLERISVLTGFRARNAYEWLWSNSYPVRELLIKNHVKRRLYICRRITWLMIAFPDRRFRQYEIAEMFNIERCSLQRLMKEHRDIKEAVQKMGRSR